MTDYYVDQNGVQQGGFDDGASPEGGFPEDWVLVSLPPQFVDQIWDKKSKSWGDSLIERSLAEDSWRLSEVQFVENQILLLQVSDPSALPGEINDWDLYLSKVKLWKQGNKDFPDNQKRPMRP